MKSSSEILPQRISAHIQKYPRSKFVKVTVTHKTFSHELDDINAAISPYDEIQSLEIRRSRFDVVSSRLLESCHHLTHLTITSTNLVDFGINQVRSCVSLQFVDLSNNQITSPNASLLGLENLEFLSYGNNKITEIPRDFIEAVSKSSVKVLNFLFNPIISELFMASPVEIANLLRRFYFRHFEEIFAPRHRERSMRLLSFTGFAADFTIVAREKQFAVHRCVLDEHSRVFKRLAGESNELRVEEHPTEAVEALLAFVYDGTVPKDADYLPGVYAIAKKFRVGELRRFCEFMLVENFCETQ